jgi:hypothetical protein
LPQSFAEQTRGNVFAAVRMPPPAWMDFRYTQR